VYGPDVRLAIVATATSAPPDGTTAWTHASIVGELAGTGISASQVGRVLAGLELAKITDFAIRYNRTARPYTWTYDARADHARHLARHAGHGDLAAPWPARKAASDGRVTPKDEQPNPSRIDAELH
jgi:hypothetical protein